MGVRGQSSAQFQVLVHNRQQVLRSCLPQIQTRPSKNKSSQTIFFSESLFIRFTEVTVYMKSYHLLRFLTNKTILGCEGTAI